MFIVLIIIITFEKCIIKLVKIKEIKENVIRIKTKKKVVGFFNSSRFFPRATYRKIKEGKDHFDIFHSARLSLDIKICDAAFIFIHSIRCS